ncbi:hypothetical protein K469DRAFT_495556, partial [Zopfia rhizophila CBS 207.26]
SGNFVIKNAQWRDDVSKRFHDALCFEMEAAGIMQDTQALVIRGISDYADPHKSSHWQDCATGAAVAFARELL